MSDRPRLVLIHGVGLDHTMWDWCADALDEHYRVVRYDLLGHGTSPDPDGPRRLEDFVGQLLGVVDESTADGNEDLPVIAGISLGGLIALAAAVRHPGRFAQIAALNTVFGVTAEQRAGARERLALTEEQGLNPVADLAIDRWFSAEFQQANVAATAAIRDRLRSTDLNGYLKAYRVFVDGDPLLPDAAGSIDCPVFAMTGELDVGSTPAMTHAIAAAAPSGSAQILDGLRHLPPVEAPAVFVAALRRALSVHDGLSANRMNQ